ncbi:MAG TPA: hypothetical protein VJZ50_11510, partial [Candidatus Limnocylindrales bacterium]|nr:hypothetical protein [Candidatus Limnocylindrales bacterium]
MTDELPEVPAAEPLPRNVSAAAVLLVTFGILAAFGTALALLATLSSGMRRFAHLVPQSVRFQWQDPMDGPVIQYGDPMGGIYLVADGGHLFFLGLLFVVLLGLLGAAIAGAHVAAGLAILQRRAWGRLLGMAGSGAALVVLVMGLASTLLWASVLTSVGAWDDIPRHMGGYYWSVMNAVVGFGTVVTLLMIAAYAFILWALA